MKNFKNYTVITYIISILVNELDDNNAYNYYNLLGLEQVKIKSEISDLLRNFITKNKKIILRKFGLERISDILPTTAILKFLIRRDINKYCDYLKKSSPDLLNISNNLSKKIRKLF